MSLAGKLSSEFATNTRKKGAGYHRGGAVKILNHTPSQVDALIRGTNDYLLRLTLGRMALHVACTCPHFEDGNECKHIWATILEADDHLYLSEADRRAKLKLDFDYEALDDLRDELADEPLDDDFDVDDDDSTYTESLASPKVSINTRNTESSSDKKPKQEPEPAWKMQLSNLSSAVRNKLGSQTEYWPSGREIFYVIDSEASRISGKLTLDISFRERTMKGGWGKIKSQRISRQQISSIPDSVDRQILTILSGAREAYTNYGYSGYGYDSLSNRCQLSFDLQALILPLICATGRCRLRRSSGDQEMPSLDWDEGELWEFWLTAERDDASDEYVLGGHLRRGEEKTDTTSPLLLVNGVLISKDFHMARLSINGASAGIEVFRQGRVVRIPAAHSGELVEQLLGLPAIPNLDFPPELQFETVQLSPKPRVAIRRPSYTYDPKLHADLSFDYEETVVQFDDQRLGIFDAASRRFTLRDLEAERQAVERLKPIGFKLVRDYYNNRQRFELAPGNLPRAVKTLLGEGWKVTAEGKLYRSPGSMNMAVSSGIDWFELGGAVEFGDGLKAELPALLSALKRGESMVQLGDGSFGLLPEEWLKKYSLLVSLGQATEDSLRFKRTQTGVLDALLAAQPEIKFDETFARAREEWQNFKGIAAFDPPQSFLGTLREYQREGLGWFDFLQRFGFGGCLADDMGLGKTVEVLALLESRRVARVNGNTGSEGTRAADKRAPKASQSTINEAFPGPSLVVVPRSLVFNWQQEAVRFTPQLRILTHTGAGRTRGSEHFQEYDLILTTYGTLRRDAADFADAKFDFVILDEAQAIKNAKTESAKAVRLLKGSHRLALSGTPIENHLGELWSLFEFLNPGMLGSASVFQLSGNSARLPNEETRAILARAIRPFVLRRTKQQVAKELPEKLEQTIYCEMEAAQRKQYDELRDYYRTSLLERVGRVGINRAKMHILEALLRLRQAACHPALVNKSEGDEPSAKLDVLLPQLREVTEEGHKALVFSQFTSFLSIVRRQLDQEKIDYEYLDGKTRDRAARVEHFQNDPKCKLFLISLKAGGLGLNLTAAEYVFLLDPWWNPAVEAQAIDRAHRIGQSRRVFAYRLITRETVEEKVLALQATKRELADSIISADDNLIRSITKEDLLLLLS